MVKLSAIRQQVESQQGTDGLDSAEILGITGNALQVFDTLDSLPMTGLSEGDEAFILDTNRLYISDGSGWYNTTLVNRSPTWATEPDASYDIEDSATPLVITALATDSDNPDTGLINQSVVSDSAQYMVDISNDSSVWTFTPKTAAQIGASVAAGNLTDSNGDFIYTFKWSDGINFVSKAVTIGYSPSGGGSSWFGDRAFKVGNQNYSIQAQIDYWDMTTSGNAADFGDLAIHPTYGLYQPVCSDKTYIYQIHENSNIQYWVSATLGNATNGYAATLRSAPMAGSAQTNGSRAIHYHGYHNSYSGMSPYVDYFPVGGVSGATCTSFGTFMTLQDHRMAGNATRFVTTGGDNQTSYFNSMQYGEYDTPASSQSFGSLAYARSQHAGMGTGSGAAADIAMVAGGTQTGTNVRTQIEYHNIATLGNGTYTNSGQGLRHMDGCNNAGKAHHAGGRNSANTSGDWIYEMDMSTTANASYFGALTNSEHFHRCSSGAAA